MLHTDAREYSSLRGLALDRTAKFTQSSRTARLSAWLRATDALVIIAAVMVSHLVSFGFAGGDSLDGLALKHSAIAATLCVAWIVSLTLFGAHADEVIGRGTREYQRVWLASGAVFAVIAVIGFPVSLELGPRFLAVALPVGLVALTVNHQAARQLVAVRSADGRFSISALPGVRPEGPAESDPLARRRVVIIGSRGYPSYYGGFETLVRKLTPFLADRGWDVVVYGRPSTTVPTEAPTPPNVTSVMTKGIDSRSLSTLSFGATAAMHAVAHNADVALVLNVANGFFLPALRLRGIPSVVNVDGLEWQRAKWSRLGKAVFKSGARFTARFANHVVCDSTNIATVWQDQFRRDSVFIPYGGDIPAVRYPVPEGLEHAKYVLLVARFVPENTVEEFLDAAETLATRYKVVIVGSSGHGGPLEDRVRELTADNPSVIWTGHISDDHHLHSLWQHCGAYFHGHSVGGTNPALVQAMACGAPTVARDTVYNREVLPESSLFVQPNPAAIVEGISMMMDSDLRRHAARSAVQGRARDLYSWEAICAAYETALINAID